MYSTCTCHDTALVHTGVYTIIKMSIENNVEYMYWYTYMFTCACSVCVHVMTYSIQCRFKYYVHNLALLAQLQNVVLCDVSERLSTVVSVLVRVRRCEDGQKTVFVLQELVELLSKMMR